MSFTNITRLFLILLVASLYLTACNRNDDQRDFERDAFSQPQNITETKRNNGEVINEDPDDWRISPFFQGLIDVTTPAFPNPALSSDDITIDLNNYGLESISGLQVMAYYSNNAFRLLDSRNGQLPTGNISLNFQGSLVAQFSENPQGLYRVIIMDGSENVISYGDIEIE